MVPRLTRTGALMAALMVLIGVSAGDAFGWGRSCYPHYQGSWYAYYYYQTPTYYYPAPAPASVSASVPSAGQPYVAMKPVTEAPPSPAMAPAPVPQYYAPAVNGGGAPRSSWNFGRFPPY